MRCKALAVFNRNKIITCIQNIHATKFWKDNLSHQIRTYINQEIKNIVEQLDNGDHIIYPSTFGFTHIYKIDTNCCVILTDEQLSPEQLKYLSLYTLSNHIPLKQIMQDTQTYTTDFRSEKLKNIIHPFLNELQKQKKLLEKTLRAKYALPYVSNDIAFHKEEQQPSYARTAW